MTTVERSFNFADDAQRFRNNSATSDSSLTRSDDMAENRGAVGPTTTMRLPI
jgi:hypothetical protein